jgi:hypothetical protein
VPALSWVLAVPSKRGRQEFTSNAHRVRIKEGRRVVSFEKALWMAAGLNPAG